MRVCIQSTSQSKTHGIPLHLLRKLLKGKAYILLDQQ